jgi:hypothetical protein
MSYIVSYTESSNPTKQPITVIDKTINTQTSLTFVGKNYAGYSSHIANNFLHLMESFANSNPPSNPIQGQLWFDNVNSQLMVNLDGTPNNWGAAGAVKKAISKPSSASTGDLWVDTINQQLYIYSGSGTNWTLVGPQYSQGALSGQIVETIYDSSNSSHNVISLYSENNRVAVISSQKFVPKKAISGFKTIQQGITLINSDDALYPGQTRPDFNGLSYRFWGTATDSDKLGGVDNTHFLRNDQNNIIKPGLEFSVNKLNIGNDYNLNIGNDSIHASNYLISSNIGNNTLEIRLKDLSDNLNTVAFFHPDKLVGIGTNQPISTLHVNGITTAVGLTITGGNNASATTPSINTAGGIKVGLSAIIGNDLTISNGIVRVSKLDSVGSPISGSIILPGNSGVYDIGSSQYQFRNLYVQNFVGNVIGNVTGNVTGNVAGSVSGSAGYLATTSQFSIIGDIESAAPISYNGSSAQNSLVFNTTANQTIITGKEELLDSDATDKFLVYREYAAEANGYITGTLLTIASVTYGTIEVGMTISGEGITPGTYIESAVQNDDTRWTLNISQTGSVGTQQFPEVLVFGSSNLYSVSKQTFLSNVSTVVVGSIMLYPSLTLPTGYLICNGSARLRSQYPDLFAALGPSYIIDAANFSLPNISSPAPGFNYIIFTGIL